MLRKVFWLVSPTLMPFVYAYVCVRGAICRSAWKCVYTSVSLQVERVHVCELVRLFTGLFVSGNCGASTQPPKRYLKYLTA